MAARRPPDPYPPGWEPFLAAICAAADDDTPRLVFADWLDENGDPDRAELIRLQCELARLPEYEEDNGWRVADLSAEMRARHERQSDLLAVRRNRWLAAYPTWLRRSLIVNFRRGFPDGLAATPAQWVRDGEFLRRATAVRTLSLILADPAPAGFFDLPTLRGLTGLGLADLPPDAAGRIADSTILDGLSALYLAADRGHPIEAPAARRLLGSPRLSSLRRLSVSDPGIGTTTGFVVAGSPHFRHLERLTFWEAGAGSDAVRELFTSPNMAGVRHLTLPGNEIADAARRGLSTTQYAGSIRELNLAVNELTAYGARLLAGWSGLRTVRRLNLGHNRLGPAGVRAILESPYADRFDELIVAGNRLSAGDTRSLSDLPAVENSKSVKW